MIAIFGLICAAAAAQCSQAALPAVASPAQPMPSEPDSRSAAAIGESSSSGTNRVRFATGSAVTVLEGTPLQVINDAPISSRSTKTGAKLAFTVTRDVVVDGILVIPCGATVFGTVVEAKQAGRLAGASNLTLQLTALNLDGKSYPLYTPPFKVTGQSNTRPTTEKIAAGAAVGTLYGQATIATAPTPYAMVNGQKVYHPYTPGEQAKFDAVTAGMGAGVGTVVAAATSRPSIALIPAESEIEFTLASPVAVYPVDQRTAARLAQGLRRGGPVLYVRGENQ